MGDEGLYIPQEGLKMTKISHFLAFIDPPLCLNDWPNPPFCAIFAKFAENDAKLRGPARTTLSGP